MLITCLCGCSEVKKEENPSEEIRSIMKEKEHIILDVRTKEEYEESHILNSENIPYDQIDETISLDKNKVIFVYCKTGNRSKIAYEKLKNMGYTVYDLGSFSNIDLPKEGDIKK